MRLATAVHVISLVSGSVHVFSIVRIDKNAEAPPTHVLHLGQAETSPTIRGATRSRIINNLTLLLFLESDTQVHLVQAGACL